MCGRFTQASTWQEIRDLYDLTGTAQNLEPRYNIAPTQQIDVVYVPDNKRLPAKMRWGLIPPWWKKTVGHEAAGQWPVSTRVNKAGGADYAKI
jgi:putative SOS response-associated peptidase YedK